jgi:Cu+-exporting ATPase
MDPIEKVNLRIEGMSCGSCVKHVEDALKGVSGVQEATVNLMSASASISYVSHGLTEAQAQEERQRMSQACIQALQEAGYSAQQVISAAPRSALPLSSQLSSGKPGARAFSAIPWDLLFAALAFSPFLAGMAAELVGVHGLMLAPLWQVLLGTVVQFSVGGSFGVRALRGLTRAQFSMDTLIALGSTSAYGWSVYHYFQNRWDALYFESSVGVLTFVLLGRFLEKKAKQRALVSMEALSVYRPALANQLMPAAAGASPGVAQEERAVPVENLRKGDWVRVRPGERFPVDGRVVQGGSSADESLITGESRPILKGPSDRVVAGSLNLEGSVDLEVVAVGEASFLGQMIRSIERAQAQKIPIQSRVDRISAVFVPFVIVCAAFTAGIHVLVLGKTWEAALLPALSVLVIACPCALGLATPAALWVGAGVAARRGLLICNWDSLERMQAIRTVVFDKTGTLTQGRPECVKVELDLPRVNHPGEVGAGSASAANQQKVPLSLDRFLQGVASLQQGSEHPLAQAVLNEVRRRGLSIPPRAESFHAHPGEGVSGIPFGIPGSPVWRVGRPDWVMGGEGGYREDLEPAPPQAMIEVAVAQMGPVSGAPEAKSGSVESAGSQAAVGSEFLSPSKTARRLGLLSFQDQIRSEAHGVVAQLKAKGLTVVLLSGDGLASSQAVAAAVGVKRVIARARPDQKVQAITQLRHGQCPSLLSQGCSDGNLPSGSVLMVGDGLNDAPALAAADVGFALAGGTDLTLSASDWVLMRPDLRLVLEALQLAPAIVRKIQQNLLWAFCYNALGIPLAASGHLTPWQAGAAMAFSSVSVLFSALAFRNWKPQSLPGLE